MKNTRVLLLDYGIGNLFSVRRSLEVCGATVLESADPADLARADRVVLPGVGAFPDGIKELTDRGLIQPLKDYAASGRPLLGICLGMQLLATVSEEFGLHAGLNIIPGRVIAVPARTTDDHPQKIPHIGWTPLLRSNSGQSWSNSILDTTPEGTSVYLVHSFFVEPDDPAHCLAYCDYGGHRLCAAMRRHSVFGVQFHPEKSGPAGLEILSRFLAS